MNARTSIPFQASVRASRQRYRGLRSEVRRLIQERRREIAASRRAAERVRRLQAAAQAQPVVVNDIGGVAGDAAAPRASDTDVAVVLPAPSSLGEAAANYALGQLGTPYVWGGAAPGGFDCSGLVTWAFAQVGRSALPHYTGSLWTAGTRIYSQADLAPGDLVFFQGLGHMGIYIGNDQFVHAPNTGDVVKISSPLGLRRLCRRRANQWMNGTPTGPHRNASPRCAELVVLSVVLNQRDLSELRAPSITQPCGTERRRPGLDRRQPGGHEQAQHDHLPRQRGHPALGSGTRSPLSWRARGRSRGWSLVTRNWLCGSQSHGFSHRLSVR